MKTAKPSGLSRVFGSIRRKAGASSSSENGNRTAAFQMPSSTGNYAPGSPEAAAIEALSKFCTTDPARTENDVDPAVYLPTIVESCESSPTASAEVAHLIGEFLGKPFQAQEQIQYKAVMILRILIDNQGVTTFVRNLNKGFASNAKTMLRSMKNPNACVLLIETLEKLDSMFPRDGSDIPAVVSMWRREKEKDRSGSQYGFALQPQFVQPPSLQAYPQQQPFVPPTVQSPTHRRDYFSREHNSRRLPDPAELASRLEEARTSAKLLQQCVSNSSPSELLDSDLVSEFTARCTSASKSVQTYIAAEDPSPDDATMENLLATNELLQKALDSRDRAISNAREARDTTTHNPTAPGPVPQSASAPVRDSISGSSPESPFIPPSSDAVTPLAPRPAHVDTGITRQLSGTPQLPPLDTSVPTTPTTNTTRGKFRENPQDLAEPVSALSSDGENPFADPNSRKAAKTSGSRHEYGIVEDSDDDLYNTTPKRATHGNDRF
ncbi:GAT domain protein [Ceratocystis lukuohia]|uniref:GAT domain protein n=1 Tax=Ceratocystis lukuohia TaxID=2019550 RepID=A0ABR4MIK7_9PEZI